MKASPTFALPTPEGYSKQMSGDQVGGIKSKILKLRVLLHPPRRRNRINPNPLNLYIHIYYKPGPLMYCLSAPPLFFLRLALLCLCFVSPRFALARRRRPRPDLALHRLRNSCRASLGKCLPHDRPKKSTNSNSRPPFHDKKSQPPGAHFPHRRPLPSTSPHDRPKKSTNGNSRPPSHDKNSQPPGTHFPHRRPLPSPPHTIGPKKTTNGNSRRSFRDKNSQPPGVNCSPTGGAPP